MSALKPPAAIFFDLDGTLVDTAPDMVGAANELRREHDLPSMEFPVLRPLVSHGSTGLVNGAFGPDLDDDRRQHLIGRFLELYEKRLCLESRLFLHAESMLADIESRGLPWGIVTNKPGWLTNPLIKALGLTCRAACVISGDTFELRKPHPLPLLQAALHCSVDPANCIYVGDAHRDIEAGRAAGMLTLLASYGYIDSDEPVAEWGADGVIDSLAQVPQWLSGNARAQPDNAG